MQCHTTILHYRLIILSYLIVWYLSSSPPDHGHQPYKRKQSPLSNHASRLRHHCPSSLLIPPSTLISVCHHGRRRRLCWRRRRERMGDDTAQKCWEDVNSTKLQNKDLKLRASELLLCYCLFLLDSTPSTPTFQRILCGILVTLILLSPALTTPTPIHLSLGGLGWFDLFRPLENPDVTATWSSGKNGKKTTTVTTQVRSHQLQQEWQSQEGHEVETLEAGQWRRGGWMSNVS